MKQLKCEMCGSTDVLKQEGVFVCQNCGTKYSAEDAKKMMIEGTVKIDDSSELSNLYQLAATAKDRKDYKQAAKFYNEILIKNPNSWEANYYSVYAEAMDSKVGEIPNEITRISNNIPAVFSLINKSNYSSEEKICIIQEIGNSFFELTILFFENYNMEGSVTTRLSILKAQENFYLQFCKHLCNNNEFMNAYGTNLLVNKLKGIYIFEDEILNSDNHIYYTHDCKKAYRPSNFMRETIQKTNAQCTETLKQYNPELLSEIQNEIQQQAQQQKGGCYVATCVYGSYDCPEVWTLRRYRDYTLAETWYGRAFIKTYYAISPTIVKWFGNTDWFKALWRGKLDKMIEKLNRQGVDNTPYSDKK